MEFWIAAFGLFLVIEGLVPAINPDGYKKFVQLLADVSGDNLRLVGLSSMIAGVLLIIWAR